MWRSYQRLSFRGGYEKALLDLVDQLEDGQSETPVANVQDPSRIAMIAESVLPVIEPQNRRINSISGKEMLRIAAGEFLYGDDQQPVYLDEFWMAKTPVTNAEYAKFVQATQHRVPDHWENGRPQSRLLNHPVVKVSWDDAQAYTQWAKCSLPREQEWEKATRGTDGRVYPWGDEEPTDKHCNFDHNVGQTTTVGRYSPLGDSPYGCVDMSGNVWEWTDSWYDDHKVGRVLRGGAFGDYHYICRAARRNGNFPGYGDSGVGFRVVEHLSFSDA